MTQTVAFRAMGLRGIRGAATACAVLVVLAGPVARAQVQTIDPNSAVDADLNQSRTSPSRASTSAAQTSVPTSSVSSGTVQAAPSSSTYSSSPTYGASSAQSSTGGPVGGPTAYPPAHPAPSDSVYHENDLIGAAEGVFGKGARGLALMIRDLLKKQGEPNAYITGREGGGAFVLGLRYGSGTLHHKIEGEMPVYWTGPSLGFDFGANAGKTFVLVYNLNDTADLFHRIGAGEGQAYLLGGFNISYLRRGDLVVIPVRMGAGFRLGVNAGYMNFTHKGKWLPF